MSEYTVENLPIDISLYSQMAAGVILSDQNENVIWVNDYFLRMMAADRNSVLGAPVSSLLGNNISMTVNEPDANRYETKNDHGESLWLHSVRVPDLSGSGFCLRLLIDITEFEHRKNIRPLFTNGMDINRVDQSTGVLNRRAIMHELIEEISRTRRYGNPLSLIMLRYPFNSSGGQHSTKNDTVQAIISCLNSQLRWVDKLGKLENGEFLIVLPESDHDAAHQTWEKINEAIMDMTIRRDQITTDYSAAVTGWVKNDTPESMLQRLNTMLVEPRVA